MPTSEGVSPWASVKGKWVGPVSAAGWVRFYSVVAGFHKTFSWVTDFSLSKDNVYQIMRGGRARWKVENETFNTLKNQGYHLEHNYGLGEKYLSMVFFSLMMLAFLVDQLQQISCPLFRELRKKAGSKQNLWERIRAVFHLFLVESMEMISRILLAGPQKIRPVFINDTS